MSGDGIHGEILSLEVASWVRAIAGGDGGAPGARSDGVAVLKEGVLHKQGQYICSPIWSECYVYMCTSN